MSRHGRPGLAAAGCRQGHLKPPRRGRNSSLMSAMLWARLRVFGAYADGTGQP